MLPRAWPLRPSLLVLLVAAPALAGCSGDGGGAEAEGADFTPLELEATATTGIIRGIVVDEAIRPVAGAAVGTTLPDGGVRNTTSNADGAFGFDELPPGTYFLQVGKEGYVDVQASADVVAGVAEPPIVKVLLAADPTSLPYVSAHVYDAFVACSFTLVTVSFAACGLAAEQTNNEFLVNYWADRPPAWIQVEAVWESTQVLGGEIGLSVTALGPPQVGVNSTAGFSPIYITINETTAAKHNFTGPDEAEVTIRLFSSQLTGTDVIPEEVAHQGWAAAYPTYNATPAPGVMQQVIDNDPSGLLLDPFSHPECIRYPVLFDACWQFGGFGMSLQQQVDVYTHFFYGYTPPPGWRFSDNGEVPQPPA